MRTEQRLVSHTDHPWFWFAVGSFVGLAVTVVGGLVAWGDRWPQDSGALVLPALGAITGVGVSAGIFGFSLAYGLRRPVAVTTVSLTFVIMSQVFAWVQVAALMNSCDLGTGPQPAFCAAGAEPPSRYLLHASLGVILGLLCVLIGRAGLGRRLPAVPRTP